MDGYTAMFSCLFKKRNKFFCDFKFASLEGRVLSKGVNYIEKEFACRGATSFILVLTLLRREEKTEIGKVTPS